MDHGIDGHQNFLCRSNLGGFAASHSMHNPGFLPFISKIIGRLSNRLMPSAFRGHHITS